MNLPFSKNLYEILEVSKDAGRDEIKKAFYSKVKEIGGPERNPEEYRKLREAYDTLYNLVSRLEYDSLSEFGDEINQLVEEANDQLNTSHPDYEKAIKLYKHAVVLGPHIARLRSLLGIAYLENNNNELACDQLNKAVDIDNTNPLYWYYLGKANVKLKKITEAENCFKKAIEIDPNDNANNIALAYLYFNNDKKHEAFDILDKAIMPDSVIDFTGFSYFYHKISLLFLDNKPEETRDVFEQIMRIAVKPEEKEYAAWMFMDFAHHLHEFGRYDLMKYLTEAAVFLSPQNKSYMEFNDFVQSNYNVANEINSLLEDKNVNPLAAQILFTYMGNYTGQLNQDEYIQNLENSVEWIKDILQTYPDGVEFKDSLKKIKIKYPACYNLNSKLFDDLAYSKIESYKTFKGYCPYCSKKVNTAYGQYGKYICPHCKQKIIYQERCYTKDNPGIFKRISQIITKLFLK